MPKTDNVRDKFRDIFIAGRISEISALDPSDIDYVEEKLRTMNQGEFIRYTISIARKYDEGKLFNDELKKALIEVMPLVLQKYNIGMSTVKNITEVGKDEVSASEENIQLKTIKLDSIKSNLETPKNNSNVDLPTDISPEEIDDILKSLTTTSS